VKFILSEDGSRAVNIDHIEEVIKDTWREPRTDNPPIYRVLLVMGTMDIGGDVFENAVVVYSSEDEELQRKAFDVLLYRLTKGFTEPVENPIEYRLSKDE